MRILHVTDVYHPRVGGIEVFVRDMVRRQALRHDVTVLTATRAAEEEPANGGVRVLRVLQRSAYGPGHRLPLRWDDYDVVHVHLSVLSPFATAVARTAAAAALPSVLTVHSMWGGNPLVVRAAGLLSGWSHWPVVWTAVSEAAARDVRRVLPGTDVLVLPNAVDVDWWRERPATAEPTRDDRPMTIVAVMRLAGRKRPMELVSMLAEVRRSVPADIPLRAVLVGDGPQAGTVADAVARHGMDGWVELPGYLNRAGIRDLYTETDVHVAPAYRESFGIAALEARAAGVPVVAMRSGGVGEFIADGVEGILCADDSAMVHALAHLATRPGTHQAMAAHNAAVRPSLDWERVLDEADDAYLQAEARARLAPRRRLRRPSSRLSAADLRD